MWYYSLLTDLDWQRRSNLIGAGSDWEVKLKPCPSGCSTCYSKWVLEHRTHRFGAYGSSHYEEIVRKKSLSTFENTHSIIIWSWGIISSSLTSLTAVGCSYIFKWTDTFLYHNPNIISLQQRWNNTGSVYIEEKCKGRNIKTQEFPPGASTGLWHQRTTACEAGVGSRKREREEGRVGREMMEVE